MTSMAATPPDDRPPDDRKVTFAASFVDHDEAPESGLFFYHVPKTGGISFFTALRFGLVAQAGTLNPPGVAPGVLRLDDDPPAPSALDRPYRLVGSHRPFGTHLAFRQSFLATTVLREPVARVRSQYTYLSMRRGEPVSPDGFKAALRDEANTNRATKQLAGQARYDQAADPHLWERAIETLTETFHSYVCMDRVDELTTYYLSLFRLPNAATTRLNRTRPEFHLDPSNHADEILERNRQDDQLYAFVRDHSRLPRLTVRSAAVHPLTVVIDETDTATRTGGRTAAIATERLLTSEGGVAGALAGGLAPFFD